MDKVFVPAHPGPGIDGEPQVRLELRNNRGRYAAVAFSSLDRLVGELGRSQPWLAMDLDRLGAVLAGSGLTEILLDPDLSASPGRWDPEDVESFTEGVDDHG